MWRLSEEPFSPCLYTGDLVTSAQSMWELEGFRLESHLQTTVLFSKIPNPEYAGSDYYSSKYLEVCTLGRSFCCGDCLGVW